MLNFIRTFSPETFWAASASDGPPRRAVKAKKATAAMTSARAGMRMRVRPDIALSIPSLDGNPTLFAKFVKVGAQGDRGEAADRRGRVGPGGVEQFVLGLRAGLQRRQQLALTLQAVREVLVELAVGIVDLVAVARVD